MLRHRLLLAVSLVLRAKTRRPGHLHLIRALVNQEKEVEYGKATSQPGELYAIIALHTCQSELEAASGSMMLWPAQARDSTIPRHPWLSLGLCQHSINYFS